LSVILLFIGISVSWRIIQQTRQELTRMESTTALNVAENIANIEGRNTDKESGLGSNSAVKYIAATEDMVYMKKGETITVIIDKQNVDGGILTSGHLANIYYGSPGAVPKLLIRRIRSHYTRSGSNCILTSTEVQQVYGPPTAFSCSGSTAGMCGNGFTNYYQPTALDVRAPAGGTPDCPGTQDRVVIMMLEADSYIGMKGLARHYRAASYSSENEARIIEQAETDPSAPGLFQFGILVNGDISY